MSAARKPLLLRFINALCESLDQIGFKTRNLDMETLTRTAMRKTGLSEWGDSDFQSAFETLIDSLQHDADLSFFGRIMAYRVVLNSLVNRLLLVREMNKLPNLASIALKPMLTIAALPRTGTTLLQRLLAQDPDSLSLPLWVLMKPIPASTLSISPFKQKVYKQRCRLLIQLIRTVTPALDLQHEVRFDQPDECAYLFMNCCRSTQFFNLWPVEKYGAWLFEQDPDPMYDFYRRNLQLLQRHMEGGHWVLKSPMHFCFLSTLAKTFPEARIIMIHRDLKRVVPSLLSLHISNYATSANSVNTARVAELVVRNLAKFSEDVVRTRDHLGDERFYDIHYTDLASGPIEKMKDVYRKFDLAWSGTLENRACSYIHGNPKNKHGTHVYSLEEYGLSSDDIDRSFAKYIERFRPIPE
jgi:hypothetical protein